MQITARLKNTRLSAQKCRLICNMIRGSSVARALDILRFTQKKSASVLKKVLDSAIANAEHNYGADIDELTVKAIFADQATNYKRMHARAKGRGCRILKPTCHVTVVLSSEENR